MIYYINAFRRDEKILDYCVKRIKIIDSESIVVVANDPNAPAMIPDLDGVYNLTTNYPRGGNLNGLDCIKGMLYTMRQVMYKFNAQYIVKIDCDSFIVDSQWIKDDNHDYLSCCRFEPWTPTGCIYKLSALAIDRLLSYIDSVHIHDGWHYPEDVTIYNMVRDLCIDNYLTDYNDGYCVGFKDVVPNDRHRHAKVIHCGESTTTGDRAHPDLVLYRIHTLSDVFNQ